jgi:flagellar L-ring protein precursor FlgH
MNSLKFVILASGIASLAGCSGGSNSIVDMPTFAPVVVSSPLNIETGGAIYQGGNTLALYETPACATRGRRIDDSSLRVLLG